MRTNRRVNPAPAARLPQHNIVQCFPHPMQTLEFKTILIRGHMRNGADRVGIMCRKLWIDPVCHAQQFAGIRDVADVSRGFLSKDRKTVRPDHLSALDFGIPIRAFDQSNHDAPVVSIGHVVNRIYDQPSPRSIGLHDHTKPIPTGQGGH